MTFRKFKPELYDERVDNVLKLDRIVSAEPPQSWDVDRGVFEARSHGTSFTDTGSICWNASTENKRAETAAYGTAKYAEQVAQYFKLVPPATGHTESYYIVGIDEPELVEHGEEYIHERLTSHLADPVSQPESTWMKGMAEGYQYYFSIFLDHLALGLVPSALLHEIVRQRFGFPYEWIGADVE